MYVLIMSEFEDAKILGNIVAKCFVLRRVLYEYKL